MSRVRETYTVSTLLIDSGDPGNRTEWTEVASFTPQTSQEAAMLDILLEPFQSYLLPEAGVGTSVEKNPCFKHWLEGFKTWLETRYCLAAMTLGFVLPKERRMLLLRYCTMVLAAKADHRRMIAQMNHGILWEDLESQRLIVGRFWPDHESGLYRSNPLVCNS